MSPEQVSAPDSPGDSAGQMRAAVFLAAAKQIVANYAAAFLAAAKQVVANRTAVQLLLQRRLPKRQLLRW